MALTPQMIDDLSYNKVIEIYDKLTINICSDIIRRIDRMGDISQASKDQIKILVELNAKEIFEKTLLETSMLDNETKEELLKIYQETTKKEVQSYKPLYKYRNKEFKLSKRQMNILEKGILKNNEEIRNFTNSIAFNSLQSFIEAVDEAYMKVVTGGFDYNSAINSAYKKVAETGLKITDKAGRNVNIDVAIRRSVLTGIQQTANKINRDIENYLGCDGYEVTAHIGARPTHAIAQGKQYAISKEDAKKYGINWWYDKIDGTPVAELWDEPNCRHTYTGIILGISEPVYSNKQLNEFENATLTYNGEKVPYYEVTQQMRYIERNIREYKKQVNILKNANKDYSEEQALLKKWRKKYTDITKETGLEKQYERVRV